MRTRVGRLLAGGSLAVLLIAATAAAAPTAARLPSLTPLLWVPDGPVLAASPFGNKLLIGGSFTKLSARTGQAALTDASTGAPKPGFPEVAGGSVNAVVSDGVGGFVVGGFFQSAGGFARAGLVRVRADGSVDPRFNPSLAFVYNVSSANPAGQVEPGGVTALALSGSTLYVGGTFNRAGGAERNGLAAFDLDGGSVTEWNPRATSSGNFVRALAVSGSTVYVAGGFSGIGNAARNGLAALDATTGQATSWNPAPDQTASALALGPGVVYAGGSFTKIGGASRQYLAALDPASGAATPWAPAVSAPVTAIALSGDTLAAGSRTRSGSTQTGAVVALGLDGSARWHADADGPVTTLASAGQTLLVGGGFRTIGGIARRGAAALDTAGKVTGWAPQPNLLVKDTGSGGSAVNALGVTSSGIVIGGDFVSIGGVARSGLAAIDPADGRPSSWHPALNGQVNAIAADAGHVYVIGRFTQVAGRARHGGAAFDAHLRLLPWNPPGSSGGEPDNLALLPGKVVMTGSFNGIAPSKDVHGSIAAFDAVDGRLLAWGPSNLVADGIGPLLQADGRIYTTFSVDTSTIVLLDPKSGRMKRGFVHNNGTGDIYGFAITGGTLYLGGAMQAVDFQYRKGLAAVDATSGKLLPWQPAVDDPVRSMLASGDVVYAGGDFRHVGGKAHHALAAIDASSGAVLAWDPQLNGSVRQLVAFPGGFAALGSFLSVNGRAQPYLALFSTG